MFGRLIIDKSRFKGEHRSVPIPSEGAFSSQVQLGKIDVDEADGKYTMIISNCNDYGRSVKLNGPSIWKSKHGFLPGERFHEWHFLIAVMVIFFILFFWYGISMKLYNEDSIELQKWILMTIGAGLVEVFFRVGDYWIWNEDGKRAWYALYVGKICIHD